MADGEKCFHQPIPAQLAHLHWSSGHDFRLSRVKSRQARETRVRFPDGELMLLCFFLSIVLSVDEELLANSLRRSLFMGCSDIGDYPLLNGLR
jgi:hypothetical protein